MLVIASVRLYREGICNSLAIRRELNVIGAAATANEALALIASGRPDVAVIDVAAHRSFEIVQRLRGEAPTLKLLAFGVEDSESDIIACAEAGVAGFVLRDASMEELSAAIVNVVRGELFCSPHVSASLFRRLATLASSRDLLPGRWISLTARERQILSLLDAGLSNKEMATELHIEVSTVKNHVHRVLEKLHVGSRAEAVARLRVGLSKRRVPIRAKLPMASRSSKARPTY